MKQSEPMTPEQFETAMIELWHDQDGVDTESAHSKADDLMCDLLESLGYGRGIKHFRDAERWYA